MSQTEKTAEEVMESLTGFDEIAVAKAFDAEIITLAEHHQTKFLRALVFVECRRVGQTDAEAWQSCMALSLKAAQDYFAADDEVDADDPETEAGKGA